MNLCTRRAIAVTPVVRVHVRVPVTLRQSFICKFFKSLYLDSLSSESIHIWTIGTLEGRLSFHDSRTPLKVLFYFLVVKTTWTDSLSDFGQLCDIDFWVMMWRSPWPIFHVAVILPYILKTFWYMNTILQDYKSVWHNIWPQNKWRSLWPKFHGPVILPYIFKTV